MRKILDTFTFAQMGGYHIAGSRPASGGTHIYRTLKGAATTSLDSFVGQAWRSLLDNPYLSTPPKAGLTYMTQMSFSLRFCLPNPIMCILQVKSLVSI
ncbi:MAG: hypothetical protein KAW02_03605 [candidate division Zixibacteria bacterium]|nr:hypothetical protein [candidate division Zixibacteria bacterium]